MTLEDRHMPAYLQGVHFRDFQNDLEMSSGYELLTIHDDLPVHHDTRSSSQTLAASLRIPSLIPALAGFSEHATVVGNA